MKLVSPTDRPTPEVETVKVKDNKPGIEVSEFLKSTYPIPPHCNKLTICPLWDNNYRLNYWGTTQRRKNSTEFVDAYVILYSIFVVVEQNKKGFTSQVLG